MSPDILEQQKAICARFGVQPVPAPTDLKVAIALNVKEGLEPLNGIRQNPEGDTSGWYIWAGEVQSDDPDFFVPLHIAHLDSWCPRAMPYLQLPPGWGFVIAVSSSDARNRLGQTRGRRPTPILHLGGRDFDCW
jgi:hypothetical protein